MAEADGDSFLSWENLIYITDFLQSSGIRNVSLLGGEPTIHPECVDFILYLLERGFNLTVFTNGMLSSVRLEEFKIHLLDVPLDRLSLVCNLNDPVRTPASPDETGRVKEFLSVMGPWVTPGFNIYRLDFTLTFLFDYINSFGMKRHLRLGIAHPVPGKQSVYIQPQDMRKVIERLYSFRYLFDTFRVSPGLDCGFQICQFTDEELGWLHRFPSAVHFRCGPAVDIAPDMSVYHCFPLCNYQRKSLFEFDSIRQLDEHFARLRDQIKVEIPGIFNDCDGCNYQEDHICGGGGLCHVLNRLIEEAPVRIAEIEYELAKNRLPA